MLTKITDDLYTDLSSIESVYKDFDETCYVVKRDGSAKNITQSQFKAFCEALDRQQIGRQIYFDILGAPPVETRTF